MFFKKKKEMQKAAHEEDRQKVLLSIDREIKEIQAVESPVERLQALQTLRGKILAQPTKDLKAIAKEGRNRNWKAFSFGAGASAGAAAALGFFITPVAALGFVPLIVVSCIAADKAESKATTQAVEELQPFYKAQGERVRKIDELRNEIVHDNIDAVSASASLESLLEDPVLRNSFTAALKKAPASPPPATPETETAPRKETARPRFQA